MLDITKSVLFNHMTWLDHGLGTCIKSHNSSCFCVERQKGFGMTCSWKPLLLDHMHASTWLDHPNWIPIQPFDKWMQVGLAPNWKEENMVKTKHGMCIYETCNPWLTKVVEGANHLNILSRSHIFTKPFFFGSQGIFFHFFQMWKNKVIIIDKNI